MSVGLQSSKWVLHSADHGAAGCDNDVWGAPRPIAWVVENPLDFLHVYLLESLDHHALGALVVAAITLDQVEVVCQGLEMADREI